MNRYDFTDAPLDDKKQRENLSESWKTIRDKHFSSTNQDTAYLGNVNILSAKIQNDCTTCLYKRPNMTEKPKKPKIQLLP